MPTDPVLLYALTYRTGLTLGEVHDLIGRWREATGEKPETLLECQRNDLTDAGLSEKQSHAVEQALQCLDEAREALSPCETAGLTVVASDDRRYPRALTDTLGRARPTLLFCAGNPRLLNAPCVSIIGSRKPPEEALEFTRVAAELFAERDVAIASGYARGIDQAASHAALDAGGGTVLFPAQGILTFGRERESLTRWIDEGRALVASPFEPRADWQTPLAMSRNAMITAMALHTVVGHAGLRGGAWEASRGALRQGRSVWVRADDAPVLGHRKLASLGAHLVGWPSQDMEAWADGLARDAHEGDYVGRAQMRWTDETAAQLLSEGSPADIHDATGLTGHTLLRIVQARDNIRLERLADLEKIDGIGPGTARIVAQAFEIVPAGPSDTQLALFPEVSEFPGWDGNLAAGKEDNEPSSQGESSEAMQGLYGDIGAPCAQGGADREEPRAPLRHRERRRRKIAAEEILALSDIQESESQDDASHSTPCEPSEAEQPPAQESVAAPSKRARPRRNLLLILVSGMRGDAPGFAGNGRARTPHLDALAWSGARCARAYTPIPRTAPARAAILTGVSHRVHGLWRNGLALPESAPTLAAHLAGQGYRTAFAGEMHFAPFDAPPSERSRESIAYWRSGLMDTWSGPCHGFNRIHLTIGHYPEALQAGHYGQWMRENHPSRMASFSPEEPETHGDPTAVQVLKGDPGSHVSSWIARQAIQLLGDMHGEDFFLVCSFPGPHAPYQPLAEDMRRFRPEDMPAPIGDASDLDAMPAHYREAWAQTCTTGAAGPTRKPSPQRIARARAAAMAETTRIDLAVGRILRQLDELGLSEKTLIVFASAHGDLLGDHGLTGCGPWHYEGLIRVPLIWNLPGVVENGQEVDAPVSLLDIAPTALELIGAQAFRRVQGMSLGPCLSDGERAPRCAALVESPDADPAKPSPRTVVTADRKMTVYPTGESGVLFHLDKDPEERNNRFDRAMLPERMEMMQHLIEQAGRTDVPAENPPCTR